MKATPIPCIPAILTEEAMQQDFNISTVGYKIPIGLTYSEVEPFYLDISQLGIMGLCGKENTGHKNFIHYLLKTLEAKKNEFPVRVTIFDDVTRKFDEYKNCSIVENYTVDAEKSIEIVPKWYSILNRRYDALMENGTVEEDNALLLMIVQNNDVAKKIGDDLDLMEQFNEMVSRFKGMNVAFIFSNYQNASLSYDAAEPLRIIKQEQHIVYFEDLDNLKPFEVPYEELKANRKKLEIGDAYYIQDNMVTKLKMVKSESNKM